MTVQFNQKHLKKFKECYPSEPTQGPVGRTPSLILDHASIAKRLRPKQYPLDKPLSRATVRKICRDKKVNGKAAYVCVMAWGGLRKNHMIMALKSSGLVDALNKLKRGMKRIDAFNLLSQAWQDGLIKGMRVSFFTKVPYFFLPEESAYILDQWTAKSANLLWKDCPLTMDPSNPDLPNPYTTPDQYEAYCQFVEALAEEMKWQSPVSAEIGMFGKNEYGINGWRKYVKS